MDLEYIEDKIDVFIENNIKEKRYRRKINYEEILLNGVVHDNHDNLVHINEHKTKQCSSRSKSTKDRS